MRIAFVCMPITGHLNPMIALARKLQARGHEILFVSFSDTKQIVQAAGLTFAAIGELAYPPGSMAPIMERFARSLGLEPVRYWIAEFVPGLLKAALEDLPRIAEEQAVDAFALDTTFNYTELVALQLHKPYIHVWNPLPFDGSGTTPPYMFDLPYDPSPTGRARNLEALGSIRVFSGPRQEIARTYPQDWRSTGQDPMPRPRNSSSSPRLPGNSIFQASPGPRSSGTQAPSMMTPGVIQSPSHGRSSPASP
jgi:zeaxanthin glucosyltransferase